MVFKSMELVSQNARLAVGSASTAATFGRDSRDISGLRVLRSNVAIWVDLHNARKTELVLPPFAHLN